MIGDPFKKKMIKKKKIADHYLYELFHSLVASQ